MGTKSFHEHSHSTRPSCGQHGEVFEMYGEKGGYKARNRLVLSKTSNASTACSGRLIGELMEDVGDASGTGQVPVILSNHDSTDTSPPRAVSASPSVPERRYRDQIDTVGTSIRGLGHPADHTQELWGACDSSRSSANAGSISARRRFSKPPPR